MKRIVDICIAIFLLLLLLPICMVILVLIKCLMGSPLFFVQKRPGQFMKPFYLYKFRTMDVEMMENASGLSRITVLGAFLRKYSLDEIPQLINVVKGDMSLVGPRPLLMEYVPLYTKAQRNRHLLKPGMTGWAQVNGRNQVAWEERFQMDLWYVQNQSAGLDCKILWLTLIKVIKKEGINQCNTEQMKKFTGTYKET